MALSLPGPFAGRSFVWQPPVIDAEGYFAPLPGGAFELEYRNVDARTLEQIKDYASFVHDYFPGWMTRVQIPASASPELNLRLFVFPANQSLHYYLAMPNVHVVQRR